jgi:hypothetical protein
LIDPTGTDQDALDADPDFWRRWTARIQQAADAFRE